MKIIRKYAEFVAYTLYHGERLNDWRCPNKKCGMGVSEEYTCCPYCGQKIKFKEPPKVNMVEISMKAGGIKELAELLEETAEEIQNLYGHDTDLSERLYCKANEIEQIETAYDVDKVMQQLEKERNIQYRKDGSKLSDRSNISIDKAIEIVKAGGINAD